MNALLLCALMLSDCPICGAVSDNHYGKRYPQAIIEAQKSACRVYAPDGSVGSGILIKSTKKPMVLTAAHVAGRTNTVVRCKFTSETIQGRVVAIRSRSDSAILVLEQHPATAPGVYLADKPADLGEHLYAFGFGGLSEKPRWQVGIRCDGNRITNSDWLELSGQARSGDSGGPILVVRNNRARLIGNLWGTGCQAHQKPQHRIIGTRLKAIRAFFPKWRKPNEVPSVRPKLVPGSASIGARCPSEGSGWSTGPSIPRYRSGNT